VQRLIAFLALQRRPMPRQQVAEMLWGDATADHSSACLRSTLWRLGVSGVPVLRPRLRDLDLDGDVSVDVHDLERVAYRLIDGADGSLVDVDYSELLDDVLPDWRDEWLGVERERFRQLRMHALEALSLRLQREGRFAQAIDASLAVVSHEPLRESAQRALISAHIREGNLQEAVRQYRSFRDLLSTELGIDPSPLMTELMRGVNVR